jgi:hypothetical protein
MAVVYYCDCCKRRDTSAGWTSDLDGLLDDTVNVCESCRAKIAVYVNNMLASPAPPRAEKEEK